MRKILTPFVAALLLLLTLSPQAKATDYAYIKITGTSANFARFTPSLVGSWNDAEVSALNMECSQDGSTWKKMVKVGTTNATTGKTTVKYLSKSPSTYSEYGGIFKSGYTPSAYYIRMAPTAEILAKMGPTKYVQIGINPQTYTSTITVEGNIMSMVYGSSCAGKTTIPSEYCFYRLFTIATASGTNSSGGMQHINSVDFSGLELPATTLAKACYADMFTEMNGCLKKGPTELPAPELADSCYAGMFSGCRPYTGVYQTRNDFTTAPVIKALSLQNCSGDIASACKNMFYGCTALTTVTAHFLAWGTTNSPTENWLPNNSITFNCPSSLDETKNSSHMGTNGTKNASIAPVAYAFNVAQNEGTWDGTCNGNKYYTSAAPSVPDPDEDSFLGWFDDETGGNEIDPSELAAPTSGITTYYAHFGAANPTYTLAWSSSGSTPTGGTAEGSYAAETSLTAPTTSKTGYTFSKWRDETNGVDFNGTMPGNDVTYTAQWTANTYYVSFDPDEGSGTMTNQTFTYGVAQNLKTNTFTGPAVTVTYDYNDATGGDSPASETVNASFANWMDGETPYDDGEEVSNLTTTNGATVELTAIWDFDQAVTLPSPTKTGYTFVQWEYGEAPIILIAGEAGGEFTPDEDVTLTAHWNAITYNLTYEGLNGASNSNPATYTVETATINLANPGTRDGYTFTGWTCGGNPITQITLGSTGDKTITANWEEVVTAFDLEDNHEAGDDYYDDYAALVTAGNAIDITYKRSFKAGRWATFSLPFGYSFQTHSEDNPFKDQVFELTSVDYADGRMVINCVKNSTGIVANKPYILIPTSDIDNPTFEGVTPKAIAAGSKTVNNTKDNVYTVEFISTAYKQVMPTGKRTIYISGNRLYYANVDTDIPAFRGYFNLKGGDDVLHIQPRLVIAAPDGETIEQAEEAVAETRKYMENGILVIERNGVKYDAQGHVIK